MKIFFLIMCAVAVVAGAVTLIDAKQPTAEIEAVLLFLIAAVFIVGAGIIDAIGKPRKP